MINLLAEVFPIAQAQLWHVFMVFLRVGATVSVLPAFGERSIPMRIKLLVAIAFSLVVAPAVTQFSEPESPTALMTYTLTEAIIGLALGITVRLFILGLQTAGAIAAQSTSLSQLLGGAAVDPLPAMGYVLVVAALALAVMTGLHVSIARALISSYNILPAGQFPQANVLTGWGVQRISAAFSLAFTLSAPFIIASLIYNLALGVINKAMPQLMVAFVGAPAITAGGLILLALSAPTILTVWTTALITYVEAPFTVQP